MEMYALAAAALIAFGAILGIVAAISLGIRREEKAHSLTTASTNRVTNGARTVCGVYTSIPGVSQQAPHKQQALLTLGTPHQ
jgi:hypothetical protein